MNQPAKTHRLYPLLLSGLLLAACNGEGQQAKEQAGNAAEPAGRIAILPGDPIPHQAARDARIVSSPANPQARKPVSLKPLGDGWYRTDLRPRVHIEARKQADGRIEHSERLTRDP